MAGAAEYMLERSSLTSQLPSFRCIKSSTSEHGKVAGVGFSAADRDSRFEVDSKRVQRAECMCALRNPSRSDAVCSGGTHDTVRARRSHGLPHDDAGSRVAALQSFTALRSRCSTSTICSSALKRLSAATPALCFAVFRRNSS